MYATLIDIHKTTTMSIYIDNLFLSAIYNKIAIEVIEVVKFD